LTNPQKQPRRRGRFRIREVRGGKWVRERGKQGLSLLPHLFTLLNLAFGFGSILYTIRGNYWQAALLTIASLVADGLDGRVARWVGADGEFGKELDSLADVVSFGVAPAILMYEAVLAGLPARGWPLVVAALFPICGALRLARFNIIKTSGFFLGVPITAAGTLLALIMLYSHLSGNGLNPIWIGAIMAVLSYLMISRIPYPDFKKRGTSNLKAWYLVVPLLVAAFALWREPWSIVMLPLALYAGLGPWLAVIKRLDGAIQRPVS
jgi:CDP-diacylglycerol--serine O-phosphatidyltransferase